MRRPILLVEDNEDHAEILMAALRQVAPQAPVELARDGEQALRRLLPGSGAGALAPALVLLDLKLPGIDGLEVLRALKDEPRTRGFPVVILTSSLEPEDLSKSYRLHANSYVRKPRRYADLVTLAGQLSHYWIQINQVEDGVKS